MPSPREIRQRLEKITPGPWLEHESGDIFSAARIGIACIMRMEGQTYGTGQREGNADFIAHAPTDIAALLERVEQAEEMIRRVRPSCRNEFCWCEQSRDIEHNGHHQDCIAARQFLNPTAQEGR